MNEAAITVGTLRWDGEILRLTVSEPVTFEGAAIAEYHETARRLVGAGSRVPLLVRVGNVRYTPMESRRAVVLGEDFVSVRALVVDNESQRTIGRTFVMHDPDGPPTEVFYNEDQAVAWIRSFEH